MNAIKQIITNDSITPKQLLTKLKEYDATLANARIRSALKNYTVSNTSTKEQAITISSLIETLKK